MWLDLDANEGNIETRDVTKYRVVHIATHGLLNAERPQFTGLVLSLVGNKSEDGFLRTDEVFNLRLGSPLVMLSACETGLGKEKRGEGVMGLTRAFMYAGAPTVGVSLWSVADKSTVAWERWLPKPAISRRLAIACASRSNSIPTINTAYRCWRAWLSSKASSMKRPGCIAKPTRSNRTTPKSSRCGARLC